MNPRSAPLHLAALNVLKRHQLVAASLAMWATLLGPGSAWASPVTTYSGSASIGNLRISVVDLDLNDGIAAGYTVVNPNGYHAQAAVYDSVAGTFSNQGGTADWWSTALNVNAMSALYSGQATVSGGNASAGLQATGYEFDVFFLADWRSFQPNAYGNVSNWLLAAHTRLVITADAQVQDQFIGCAVLGCESASQTFATLEAGMFGDIDTKVQDYLSLQRYVQYDGVQRATLSDTTQRAVTVMLDNPSDQSRLAYGSLAVFVSAYSYASPANEVPEPNSLALIALGLAALRCSHTARRKNSLRATTTCTPSGLQA